MAESAQYEGREAGGQARRKEALRPGLCVAREPASRVADFSEGYCLQRSLPKNSCMIQENNLFTCWNLVPR